MLLRGESGKRWTGSVTDAENHDNAFSEPVKANQTSDGTVWSECPRAEHDAGAEERVVPEEVMMVEAVATVPVSAGRGC
jgi:hypothetical protein